VTVQAVDNQGHRSDPAQTEVTLLASSAQTTRVWPNPWRADRPAPAITFDQMANNSTVKIFTLTGRWVRTLPAPTGTAPWDLKNDDVDAVASGLYIYLVTDDQGGKIHGKLAIIR
jgi:hypothetical protein